MSEKTKQKKDSRDSVEKETGEFSVEKEANDEKGNWSEDQKEKSYYYDDAYGYEIYNPDENEDAENVE